MKNKRGQTDQYTNGAAVTVAIIAGLIVLYILFLQPADREALLDESLGDDSGFTGSGASTGRVKNISIIVDEDPGRIDYISDDEFEIDIPSFNLYKTTNAKEIETFNDFSIRNGWFDEKDAERTFTISDLDNTDNIILSFLAKTHKGTLTVLLNGDEIYESKIDTQNIEPIKLRKSDLEEGENTLSFTVDGVGGAFWRTNEYAFSGMKIIGDITDVSRQKTKNIFTIEAWKYTNLEKATLKFNPDCKQSAVGVLDVLVNDIEIFSGTPDCGMLNRYPVPVGALDGGVNDVVFKTNEGSYLIDQIKIRLELEELSSPLYWFEVSEDQMENITEGLLDVNLTLEFVDDGENKKLDVNVNGHMRRIDQDEPFYGKNINSWVEEGRNYVKLIPKKTVEIVDLQVKMIELDEEEDE